MTESRPDRESEFDRIVHEYYQAIEDGRSVDPHQFIDSHPDFHEELKSFFADVENLGQAAGGACLAGTIGLDQTRQQNEALKEIGPGKSVTYVGEYRILEEIARGGMGVVFKARQEKLKRIVALKMILNGRFASDLEVDRFRREARAAASLKHPGIVGVHEIGQHDGYHYFTMDYVESESLAARLQRGSLTPQDAAEMLRKLAGAIHYAHQKGVLHRDLKPGNVLIDRSGNPHITDFGLAKPFDQPDDATVDEITYSGQILGTPSYMSPEQASAKHQLVSVASDVYSLGAILYACLSGRAPFLAESSIETLRQVINDDPLPLRILNARVPRDLENICMKCLAKEPHRRYGTANEFGDDLQNFLTGKPVVARPISRFAKTYRWARRNPWMAATAMLLFLFALSGPIVGFRESSLRSLAQGNLELADEAAERAFEAAARAKENEEKERQSRIEADRSTARAKYFLAMAHRDAGRAREALRTLEEVPKDHRAMEWNLAYRQALGSAVTLYGHTGEVLCVDVSPDDHWIASASDGELRIWNMRNTQQHRLIATDGRVTCLKFLDDSRRLLASIDNRICIWDAVAGRRLQTLEETGPFNQIQCFAISRDEKTLITGTGGVNEPGNVSYWNLENGERTKRLNIDKSSGVRRIDISPNKQLIATVCCSHKYSVRDFDSGDEKWAYGEPTIDLAFHPSAGTIARLEFGGDIVVQFAASATEQTTFPWLEMGRGLHQIRWNPEGSFVAIGTIDGRIYRVSPSIRRIQQEMTHLGAVNDIAFCSDTVRFVTAGADRTIRISGVSIASPTLSVPNTFPVSPIVELTRCRNADWSPDGNRFASGTVSNQITVWDSKTLEVVHTIGKHPDLIQDIAFFPDSERIASACADKLIRVWKLGQSEALLTLAGHRGFISEIDVSPSGKWIVSGERNVGEIRLWDAKSGQMIHSWRGRSPRFSPDDQSVAYFTTSGIKIREIVSDQVVQTIKPTVAALCFCYGDSSSVLWVGGGERYSNGFEAWNLGTGKQVFRKSLGTNEYITNLSFSPAHNRLLTADIIGTIKLWDANTGEELWKYESGLGTRQGVIRISPKDSSFIFSSYVHRGSTGGVADIQGTVRVWDASDRFEVANVYSGFEGEIQAAGFSSDGNQVIAISERGEWGAWDRISGTRLNSDSFAKDTNLNDRFDSLIAIPFHDRIRTIDLTFYAQPRYARIQELSIKDLEYHMRILAKRHGGNPYNAFELGWLIERGDLSEAEKNRLLHLLAKGASSLRSQYAKNKIYSSDTNTDLNLLLPRDVRRAVEKYSLDDPKWMEDVPPEPHERDSFNQSSLAVAAEIEAKMKQAAALRSRKNFDGAREIYLEVLRTMQSRTEDPLEALAYVTWSPLTVVSLLEMMASLDNEAGQDLSKSHVIDELTEIIRAGVPRETPQDWRMISNVWLEVGQLENAEIAFKRYFLLSGKSEMVLENGHFSDDLPAEDFRVLNRLMLARGSSPLAIEGKTVDSKTTYRGKYKRYDGPYYYYYGLSDDDFSARNDEVQKKGFELVNHSTFQYVDGGMRHCAIWEYPPPSVDQGRIEGESLKRRTQTGGVVRVQDMTSFEAGRWSSDRQSYWSGVALGDELTFLFQIEAAGQYHIAAGLTTAPDYGTVDIYLDDQILRDSIDLYGPRVDWIERSLGTRHLQPGKHRIRIVMKGRHPDAVGNNGFGLDYLHFERDEPVRSGKGK